jgi:putative ABC transport system permease protein
MPMGTMDRAFRNIWRKKARTVMVVGLLSISLATMISVYSTIDASDAKTEEMIDNMETTLFDFQEQAETDLLLISISTSAKFISTGTTTITENEMAEVESLDEVHEVFPVVTKPYGEIEEILKERESSIPPGGIDPSNRPGGGLRDFMGGTGNGDPSSWIDYTLQGLDLTGSELVKTSLLPENIVEGRAIGNDEMYAALISEELMEFFDAGLGDNIEIEGVNLNVVGIYSRSTQNNYVYTTISTAQFILGLDSGEYQQLNVYAANESVIDGLVTVLQEYFPSYRVYSNAELNARRVESMEVQTEQQIISLQTDMEEIESTGFMVIMISMGTAGIIVLFIMLYTVRERTKEIGTLKAIGFTSSNVMSQFLAEGILLAFVGSVIGAVLGVLASPIISEMLMPSSEISATGQISIFVIAFGIIIMVVLGSIGSLYPSFVASRKNPVEAMRHE